MKKIVFVGLVLAAPPAAAQTATAVLATAEATYHQIETLHAEFTQMRVNPMMGDETIERVRRLPPEAERGRIVGFI